MGRQTLSLDTCVSLSEGIERVASVLLYYPHPALEQVSGFVREMQLDAVNDGPCALVFVRCNSTVISGGMRGRE